eukprot:76931-Amphidinium_carterae.1
MMFGCGPFKDNRVAARAVGNIKLDFKESGEKHLRGIDTVLAEQKKLGVVGLLDRCSKGSHTGEHAESSQATSHQLRRAGRGLQVLWAFSKGLRGLVFDRLSRVDLQIVKRHRSTETQVISLIKYHAFKKHYIIK